MGLTDSSPLTLPAARKYVEAMQRFGAVVRGAAGQQLSIFLPAVDVALAALYLAGSELPELTPDTSDLPEKREVDYASVQAALAGVLGRFDPYRDIYNPSDPNDREPVQYLLSLDLVEILEDQEEAASLLEPGRQISPADVVWQWRFGLTSHWGMHAASALRVVKHLL